MLNVDYYEFLRQLLVAEAQLDALREGARPQAAMAQTAAMGGGR